MPNDDIDSERPKDWWDKLEIIGKVAGAIAVPALVGLLGFLVDDRISRRDAATNETISERDAAANERIRVC